MAIPPKNREEKDIKILAKGLERTPFLQKAFMEYGEDFLRGLCHNLVLFKKKKGEVLFRKGDPPLRLYIVLTGSVETFVYQEDGTREVLSVLRSQHSFGDMALTSERPREAHATCLEDTEFAILDKPTYEELLAKEKLRKIYSLRDFLEDLFIFQGISASGVMESLQFLKFGIFHHEHLIVKEGEIPQCIYIVRFGSVRLSRVFSKEQSLPFYSRPPEWPDDKKSTITREVDVCLLGPGEIFGDLELVKEEPFRFSIRCHSDQVEVIKISKENFFGFFMNENSLFRDLKVEKSSKQNIEAVVRKKRSFYSKIIERRSKEFRERTAEFIAPVPQGFLKAKIDKRDLIGSDKADDLQLTNYREAQKKFGHPVKNEEGSSLDKVQREKILEERTKNFEKAHAKDLDLTKKKIEMKTGVYKKKDNERFRVFTTPKKQEILKEIILSAMDKSIDFMDSLSSEPFEPRGPFLGVKTLSDAKNGQNEPKKEEQNNKSVILSGNSRAGKSPIDRRRKSMEKLVESRFQGSQEKEMKLRRNDGHQEQSGKRNQTQNERENHKGKRENGASFKPGETRGLFNQRKRISSSLEKKNERQKGELFVPKGINGQFMRFHRVDQKNKWDLPFLIKVRENENLVKNSLKNRKKGISKEEKSHKIP